MRWLPNVSFTQALKTATIVKALCLLLFSLYALCAHAQQSDQELITKAVETYFDGWMTGDTTKIGQVMHTSCKLKMIRDAEFLVIDRNSYLGRFKPRPALEGGSGRIISVDVTGNIASVKCEIEIPERIFTDYFNLVRIDGSWYIVDKVSTSTFKPKSD